MKKLRIWDSKLISDIYSIAAQMRHSIDIIIENSNGIDIVALPNSMVPTETLYELCICYEMLYSKVLEYDLINTGNIKQTHTLN